jgi:tetratricopeptide (TPR) repeat protein
MKSIALTGVVASIVTLLAMGVAVARDATWKDCELGARDPDRSIAACSKLLKRPSSRAHATAFHQRGRAYAAKGKLDQAISDSSAGIKLDPQSAYLWQDRGELYARQGKYQQAIADFTEPEPPSLKLALPILAAAADENREELQKLWEVCSRRPWIQKDRIWSASLPFRLPRKWMHLMPSGEAEYRTET